MALFQSGTYNLAQIADQATLPVGRGAAAHRTQGPGQRHQRHCRGGQFGHPTTPTRSARCWPGWAAARATSTSAAAGRRFPRCCPPSRCTSTTGRPRASTSPVLPRARRPPHRRARRCRLRRRDTRPSSRTSTRCSWAAGPSRRARGRSARGQHRRQPLTAGQSDDLQRDRRRAHHRSDGQGHPVGAARPRRMPPGSGPVPPRAVIASPISSARRNVTVMPAASRSTISTPQRRRRALTAWSAPAGAAAAARRTSAGTRRSASGKPSAPRPAPPPSRRPGCADSLQRAAQSRATAGRDVGDVGGPRHHRAQRQQHDRHRGEPQEVQQPAEADCRPDRDEISGLPPASAAVTPPSNSRSTATAGRRATRRAGCAPAGTAITSTTATRPIGTQPG